MKVDLYTFHSTKIWSHNAVSRFTETDRNGPKRTYENTETDVEEYQNGLK